MSAHCQITGATPGFGNNLSHSHRRTRRRYDVNLHRKKYWVPSLGRMVSVRVSARGIKTIEKIGIEKAVTRMLARGEKI